MNKEDFIKECAMRNLVAAIQKSGTLNCETPTINRCVKLAKELADKLYLE